MLDLNLSNLLDSQTVNIFPIGDPWSFPEKSTFLNISRLLPLNGNAIECSVCGGGSECCASPEQFIFAELLKLFLLFSFFAKQKCKSNLTVNSLTSDNH